MLSNFIIFKHLLSTKIYNVYYLPNKLLVNLYIKINFYSLDLKIIYTYTIKKKKN